MGVYKKTQMGLAKLDLISKLVRLVTFQGSTLTEKIAQSAIYRYIRYVNMEAHSDRLWSLHLLFAFVKLTFVLYLSLF